MPMKDLGYKSKDMMGVEPSKPEKNRIHYPNVHMYEEAPDFLMKKKVGDTCTAMVKIKITHKGIDEGRDGKRNSISFDIQKMGLEDSYKGISKKLSQLDD